MNEMTPPSSEERAKGLKGLGSARKRVEDVRFTQGKGNYVDDIRLAQQSDAAANSNDAYLQQGGYEQNDQGDPNCANAQIVIEKCLLGSEIGMFVAVARNM